MTKLNLLTYAVVAPLVCDTPRSRFYLALGLPC
jgi:hypothetical protein